MTRVPVAHPPRLIYRIATQVLGGSMWFWMLYRAKQDGPVLLGWAHPWELHGHGHGHGEEEAHH
ncbi:hypothetical protein SAICODRAFT_16700 [Saitoella complicata NRRL Y-17804]|uniref:uncharacterized protein n=1 Tax=Saitoella complicata (strain BCRC 22490 / CBS 7301 / JCM 7358 / NBRC 10748 / NRRL Y-17804) TaxID=698492 RepID=UPI0008675776|nr:uncharacterized protein SAICODRAFT_16700 [Saitoella complicata NRRL Y-17804]ODQ55642.1 hypothetical protein SAICODRAFT_16700 [Saitoella complicata NRRL Y-17804]